MSEIENGRVAAQPGSRKPSPAVSALTGFDPSRGLWPVYEFRPRECHSRGTVLRYANGEWLPDDGEWDIAFVSFGMGAPLGLGVELPYQRNILWRGKDGHWTQPNHNHHRSNPWHYMLREGETAWGGAWGKDMHPNSRAADAAMKKCCALNSCANGVGPQFEITDPYIVLGLVRDRETKEIVRVPTNFTCMYCGDIWKETLLASAIETGTAETEGLGPKAESAAAKPDAQPMSERSKP